MSNDLLFLLNVVVSFLIVLLAFKAGRTYMAVLTAVYAVLMNIFVVKQMTLFGLTVTGSNVLYSTIFLVSNILLEHYGKKAAAKVVMIGFFASLTFMILSQFNLIYTPNSSDFAQGSFATLFSLTPRIVVASMIAYLVAQFMNIYLFQWIKEGTNGKYLWLRNNAATFIAQAVDTVLFTALGLYKITIAGTTYGVLGASELLWAILFTYIIKVIIAVCSTPFIYLSKLEALKPEQLRMTFFQKLFGAVKSIFKQ